jgi:predicted nucleic acid-binding protein
VTEAFFDTNTLLYVIAADAAKSSRATELLRKGGAISVQVLNEFTTVALRKHALTLREIELVLEPIRVTCRTQPLTEATYDKAAFLAGRYRYAFYDCVIIAAALLADCDVLYSEDLQHGQVIEGVLTIINPFR